MVWFNKDGEHEGASVPLFADGAVGSGWRHGGVLVTCLGDGTKLAVEEWQSRPESGVIGWLPVCSCGWRGTPATRVPTAQEHDPARRQIFCLKYHLDEVAENALMFYDEWKAHIEPFDLLAEVKEAAVRHDEASRDLDEAVRAAMAAGASWADVERAAGVTSRHARERWAARA